jgi:hypothetical protein
MWNSVHKVLVSSNFAYIFSCLRPTHMLQHLRLEVNHSRNHKLGRNKQVITTVFMLFA